MATALGAFQFDNLVQARIPFLLVNLGVNTSVTYQHVFKMHLDRTLLQLENKDVAMASTEEIIAGIQSMKYPNISAIVVIDQDETKSIAVAESLENAGYTNSFYLRGGWNQLVREKAEGF